MKVTACIALFLLFSAILAVNVPIEWQKTKQIPAPSTEINLIISLFQENLHELEVRLFVQRSLKF